VSVAIRGGYKIIARQGMTVQELFILTTLLQDELDLIWNQTPVERHNDRPDLGQCEVGFHELGTVHEQQANTLTLLETGIQQRVGEPVTIAASLASATPVLLKALDVLKKSGLKTEDVNKIAAITKKATTDFENLTGRKVTDVIFKKETGVKTEVKRLSSNDLKPTTTQDAEKVVTAAVAQSTGVDPQVIKEIKETVAIDTPITAAPGAPTTMKNLFGGIDNKMLLIGGGALLLAFFVFKRR
jgi:hypothetical protein